MPHPLASIDHHSDSVWGNDTELVNGRRILLNASSGKGKSTFAGTLFGLRRDYEGSVTFDGKDIRSLTPSEWSEIRAREISAVFQDLQLFPKLTVAENLMIKNNLTKTFETEKLRTMLETVGIGEKWNQHCGLLSMVQQQRVAIIRALAQPYKWLILDEPFSHLDVENSKKALDMIHQRTVEQGASFVLTTLGDSHGYEYDQELKL